MTNHQFERTTLWRRTLGASSEDEFHRDREQLRSAFLQFRATVEPLAGEIALSMPMFTDHSILHIDSLWDTASLVCGEDYPVTPTEAFILGGAFLMHDLGMGLAAYPDGIEKIKQDPQFLNIKEILSLKFDGTTKDAPDQQSLENDALVTFLRLRHAKQAERLMRETFHIPGGTSFHLLQDATLREKYGGLIGSIAHSHWWDVDALGEKFHQRQGSLPEFPPSWTVDPLKIACILRLADAVHIDSRRAPAFLHAFRRLSGPSAHHWKFQQRLNRPMVVDDRLEYTSTSSFGHHEAADWWMAYEAVQTIDDELRRVDALCADFNRPRFVARSVAGADSPARFAKYVPTDGWRPMDASLRATQVENLVGNLGGEFLYGKQPTVAIRELIANAADATKARVAAFGGSDAVVTVSLRFEDNCWWLSVADNGIGMDSMTLVTSMTDFGRSSWKSEGMLQSYPKLLENHFAPVGRFGIGFFSIFMIADEVHVKSLKYFDSPNNTHILDFLQSFKDRPLLRVAQEDERLHIGGTVVEAKLKLPPDDRGGILGELLGQDIDEAFTDMLIELCALAEVDVDVVSPNATSPARIVRANDWRYIPLDELFDRIYKSEMEVYFGTGIDTALMKAFSSAASEIRDSEGEIVARAMLEPNSVLEHDDIYRHGFSIAAKVYVGGFLSDELDGALGAFQGYPLKADRNSAFPLASLDEIRRWANKQVDELLPIIGKKPEHQMLLCKTIESFGTSSPQLPCAIAEYRAMTRAELTEWTAHRDSILLIPTRHISRYHRNDGSVKFFSVQTGSEIVIPDDAIVLDIYPQWAFPSDICPRPKAGVGGLPGIPGDIEHWWNHNGNFGIPALVIGAITDAWSIPIEELLQRATSHGFLWYDEEDCLPLDLVDEGAQFRVGVMQLRRPQR